MDLLKLSKEVSYALRHAPHEYELELDEEGWVDINQLLESLRQAHHWRDIQAKDLIRMINTSEKKRHELLEGKIRALYGHSLPQKIIKEVMQPPDVLYHGTARSHVISILEQGLLPKGRQYVHLSADVETALRVGQRRDEQPTILKINAREAWVDGTIFYSGNEKVWLADTISPKYITVAD